ncbi:hypothetical protein L1887_25066 [Cichorium endivia]|nr:hypothetical protein L1887_25066 [Cichorium endivia]
MSTLRLLKKKLQQLFAYVLLRMKVRWSSAVSWKPSSASRGKRIIMEMVDFVGAHLTVRVLDFSQNMSDEALELLKIPKNHIGDLIAIG